MTETFMVGEILKTYRNNRLGSPCYYYRIPTGTGRIGKVPRSIGMADHPDTANYYTKIPQITTPKYRKSIQ